MVLLQNVLQIVGIQPAGQQILYGLIILLMLFVYGRKAQAHVELEGAAGAACAPAGTASGWSVVMLRPWTHRTTPNALPRAGGEAVVLGAGMAAFSIWRSLRR